jgi:hypothetical protein
MRYAAAGTLASDTRYTRRYRDAVMLSRVTASAADVERLCPLMSARLPRHALAAAMHARARCCRCCCRAIGARAPAQSRGSMPIAPMFYYASFAPQAADSFLCDARDATPIRLRRHAIFMPMPAPPPHFIAFRFSLRRFRQPVMIFYKASHFQMPAISHYYIFTLLPPLLHIAFSSLPFRFSLFSFSLISPLF